MSDKVIVTAAITGSIHTPTMSPHLPITPKQIAGDAVRAYEAGAAVVHVHVRNPETGQPMPSVELFGEIVGEIKRRCPVVVNITTGGALGQTTQQRSAAIPVLKPELASLNAGSMNFALFQLLGPKLQDFKQPWEKPFLASTEDTIFPNTFKTLREFSEIFKAAGTKPELEVYDLGMVTNVGFLADRGILERPVYLQFVLGILGGAPATLENLMFLHRAAKEAIGEFKWSVAAAGRHQFNLCTLALLMGGNVRVGLEDNLYLDRGVIAKSNAEQVEKVIRIAGELGRKPATPDEAREILGLKGIANVAY